MRNSSHFGEYPSVGPASAAEFTPSARFIVPSGEVLQGQEQIRADATKVLGGVLDGASHFRADADIGVSAATCPLRSSANF